MGKQRCFYIRSYVISVNTFEKRNLFKITHLARDLHLLHYMVSIKMNAWISILCIALLFFFHRKLLYRVHTMSRTQTRFFVISKWKRTHTDSSPMAVRWSHNRRSERANIWCRALILMSISLNSEYINVNI